MPPMSRLLGFFICFAVSILADGQGDLVRLGLEWAKVRGGDGRMNGARWRMKCAQSEKEGGVVQAGQVRAG